MKTPELSQGFWAVSEQWLELCKSLAQAEVERLDRTVRYRLGRAFVAVIRRPWRLARLVVTLRSVVREGGTGNTAPLVPPYPARRDQGDGPDSAARVLALRREIAQLWQRVRAIETSLEFRFGNTLIESKVSVGGILKLPRSLIRLASANPPSERAIDPSSLSAARASATTAVTTAPANGPPGWQCLAPSWLEEMLDFEGISPFRASRRTSNGLIVGLDTSDERPERLAELAERVSALDQTTSPVAIWLLGERTFSLPESLVSACRAVFVADSQLVTPLSKSLSVPVHHLPVAIQPRLHNPIGWWGGTPEFGVMGHHEGDLPQTWRTAVDLARGLSPTESALAALHDALGLELTRGTPPTWATADAAVDWTRHARIRQLHATETLADRLRTLESALDLTPAERPKALATVLVCTNRPQNIPRVLDAFERQTYSPRELVLVAHGDAIDAEAVRARFAALSAPARIVTVSAKRTLGEALQAGTDCGAGQIFVRMDDDDWYGAHFVEDYATAFAFSEAALVGKPTFVLQVADKQRFYLCNPGIEYQYTIFRGGGPKLAFRRDVLSAVKWRPLVAGEDKWFVRDCLANGFVPLAIDRFNFAYYRGKPQGHTTSRPAAEWVSVNKAEPYPASAKVEDFES